MLNHKLKTVSNSRVVLTGDLTSKYITYVCFTVTHRTNSLIHYQNEKYSEEKEHTHNLMKSNRYMKF
jgi:hypothetical protein